VNNHCICENAELFATECISVGPGFFFFYFCRWWCVFIKVLSYNKIWTQNWVHCSVLIPVLALGGEHFESESHLQKITYNSTFVILLLPGNQTEAQVNALL